MEKSTRLHLEEAMKGEALAYVKYMLFAERAREEGRVDSADLLERVAHEERYEHFRELAELYGLLGDTEENLENALEGESLEVETTYRLFASDAQQAGDKLVADRFEEIRHDELRHRELFEEALAHVRALPAADVFEVDL
jgi:rubrerythrin